jgi:hypothetical protein
VVLIFGTDIALFIVNLRLTRFGERPMKRTKSIYLALLAVLLSPMAANADPIYYDYAGFDFGDGWTSTGTIAIDEADVTAGGDLVSEFVSWAFTWTNGVDTASIDSSNSYIDTSTGVTPFFTADLTSVLTAQLCFAGTGARCRTDFFPVFGVFNTNEWTATTPSGGVTNDNVDAPGEWTVRSVPEPGTLALLGIGLFGMGLSRRRKAV